MEIKIKLGDLELEFEGDDNFLKDEIGALINKISSITGNGKKKTAKAKKTEEFKKLDLTTISIADAINCKTGVELILAVAARFTFVLEQDSFTRQELLDEMKTADGYFTKNYNINIANYLKSLVRDEKLVRLSKFTYSLSSHEKSRLWDLIKP